MDGVADAGKALIKSVVPDKVLDTLWSRYLHTKSKHELTVAKSLVGSPDELEAIQLQHAASNNEKGFLTIDWLRKRIQDVQNPQLKSYFAAISEEVTPSLCAPDHCYRALIDSVITVSVQSNLRIGYVESETENVVYISNYA